MATLTLQPDETSGIDTYIDAANPTTNYGTNANILIGNLTTTCRGLVKFDLSSLASTAIIISAKLTIYLNSETSSNNRNIEIYRMKTSWVEGEATWNQKSSGVNWTTAGGFSATDCEQTNIGYVAFSSTEAVGSKSFYLNPKEIKEMYDGTFTNNGFMIKVATESTDRYTLASSSDTTASRRPTLEIVYFSGSGQTTTMFTLGSREDTYIRSDTATTNYHTSASIDVGDLSNLADKRGILDTSFLSFGYPIRVREAYLVLYLTGESSNNNRNLRVYRFKVSNIVTETTWNVRSTGVNWTTAGGFSATDCEQTDIGLVALTSTEAAGYKSISLTASAIEQMANGTFTNNGLLLKVDTEADTDTYTFASADNTYAPYYPFVEISYDRILSNSNAVVFMSDYGII